MGIPAYLNYNPGQWAQSYLSTLPGQFDTSGLQNAYKTQEASNWNSGSAIAAAASNQYTQRANQTGASSLGAGFAQASAMLPVYQQNASMQSDLQNKLLQYHSQQAQIGAGLASDIGKQQGQYQSTLSDYFLNQQKLQQQQSQFGQTLGFQQQQEADQNRLNALGLAQKMPRQSYSFSTDNAGNPMTGGDALGMQQFNRQNQFLQSVRSGIQSYF